MINFNKYKIQKSIILHSKIIDEVSILFYLNQLDNNYIKEYNQINSIKRKKEFITTRILLKKYFKNHFILEYVNRKPILNNNFNISISHKENELVLSLNRAIKIGLDIEKIDPKILNIKSKFCNDIELIDLKNNENSELITMYWCAKEATFKCIDDQKNCFLSDITVKIVNKWRGYSEYNDLRYILDFKYHEGKYIICHAQREN